MNCLWAELLFSSSLVVDSLSKDLASLSCSAIVLKRPTGFLNLAPYFPYRLNLLLLLLPGHGLLLRFEY